MLRAGFLLMLPGLVEVPCPFSVHDSVVCCVQVAWHGLLHHVPTDIPLLGHIITPPLHRLTTSSAGFFGRRTRLRLSAWRVRTRPLAASSFTSSAAAEVLQLAQQCMRSHSMHGTVRCLLYPAVEASRWARGKGLYERR